MGSCQIFTAPLQIVALEKPKNYDQIMGLLQDFSLGYQKGQPSTGRVQLLYFSLIFSAFSMVCLFVSSGLSDDLIHGFSKLIRFQKFISAYTIVPLYCCVMIMSMSLCFGYETKDALTAVEKAAEWKQKALRRNSFLAEIAKQELNCSAFTYSYLNLEQLENEDASFLGYKHMNLFDFMKKNKYYINIKSLYAINGTMLVNKHAAEKFYALSYILKMIAKLFEPIEKAINETFDALNLPTKKEINMTRITILVMSTFTVFYTIFVWSIIILEIKNTNPFIIKIIQYIQPVLLFFILFQYFLIWQLLISSVDSFSTCSRLLTTDFQIRARHKETWAEIFEVLAKKNESFPILGPQGEVSKNGNKILQEWMTSKVFRSYVNHINRALILMNQSTNSSDLENARNALKEMRRNEKLNTTRFLEIARFSHALEQPKYQKSIENAVESYSRYLSYFNKYTFVPIASPAWRIVTMPVLMFFNLVFIVLAIPLIETNREQDSSEEFI